MVHLKMIVSFIHVTLMTTFTDRIIFICLCLLFDKETQSNPAKDMHNATMCLIISVINTLYKNSQIYTEFIVAKYVFFNILWKDRLDYF